MLLLGAWRRKAAAVLQKFKGLEFGIRRADVSGFTTISLAETMLQAHTTCCLFWAKGRDSQEHKKHLQAQVKLVERDRRSCRSEDATDQASHQHLSHFLLELGFHYTAIFQSYEAGSRIPFSRSYLRRFRLHSSLIALALSAASGWYYCLIHVLIEHPPFVATSCITTP